MGTHQDHKGAQGVIQGLREFVCAWKELVWVLRKFVWDLRLFGGLREIIWGAQGDQSRI